MVLGLIVVEVLLVVVLGPTVVEVLLVVVLGLIVVEVVLGLTVVEVLVLVILLQQFMFKIIAFCLYGWFVGKLFCNFHLDPKYPSIFWKSISDKAFGYNIISASSQSLVSA